MTEPEKPYFRSYDMMEPVPKRRLYTLRKRVRELRSPPYFPFAAQGSQEWLDLRKGMLTASDWGVILGEGHAKPDSVLYKKCGVGKRFTGSDATRWGHKYEDVAVQIYERRNKTKVIEFGLIPHSRYDFLGASPDGITEDGVMVEIKCPYSRHITGEPPRHYWCQVQAQLEVCKLDRADFLECKLEEYDTEEEYWMDMYEGRDEVEDPLSLGSNAMEKGILMEWWDRDNFKNVYSYVPLGLDKEEVEAWCAKEKERVVDEGLRWRYEDLVFWNLTRVSCVSIPRDKKWFSEALPKLRKFWQRILHYREHGGLPEKKKRVPKAYEGYKDNPLAKSNPFMKYSNKEIKPIKRKSTGSNAASGPKKLFGNPFGSKSTSKSKQTKLGNVFSGKPKKSVAKKVSGNPFASKTAKKKKSKSRFGNPFA